ncbi:TetR/AcrR family transcriptional regulator [Bradyrhizobium sp. dw_78]|uniref:TetR/AcrR family transcriptional regulator n=1 Tax=Bradyrhizobium sp. dw_78 TaxID=2719793 RepID=UPI001BD650E1|nr:TetR/AcrR family transcriptional regulator [Bradyrhizobium sp. dw_78]
MPAAVPRKRSASLTRQRILKAALARFAEVSYEEVGLRDIARDVGVDVALVHRSFGSKEKLFAEAFKAAVQSERLLSSKTTELGAALTRNIFERGNDPASGHAVALQIFVHSLSSPQAREVLRTFVLKDFIRPLAAKLDDRAPQRAALITACLVGVSILRDVLKVRPLLDRSRAESQPLIEKILNMCLDDSGEANPSTVGSAATDRSALDPRVGAGIPARRGAGGGRRVRAAVVRSARADNSGGQDMQ